jgi:hypothetical protein
MSSPPSKPLMRSLGEFFGHIVKGIRTNPESKTEERRTVEEEDRGDVILRRTTIEEIEIKKEGTEGLRH